MRFYMYIFICKNRVLTDMVYIACGIHVCCNKCQAFAFASLYDDDCKRLIWSFDTSVHQHSKDDIIGKPAPNIA